MMRSLLRFATPALLLVTAACSGDDAKNSSNSAGESDTSCPIPADGTPRSSHECPTTNGTDTVATDTMDTNTTPGSSGPTTGDTAPTTTDPTSGTGNTTQTTDPTTGSSGTTGSECEDAIEPFVTALALDGLGAAMIDSPLGNVMTHSDGNQTTTSENETDIGWYGGIEITLGADASGTDFPCGDHSMGFTVCPASTETPAAGDYVVIAMVLAENIVPGHASNWYQYGFVFDGDGNTGNNYQPSASYPDDFWQDTDRWAGVTYDPVNGWQIVVQDATNGNIVPITPSQARVVVIDNAMLLLIPKSEIGGGPISFRTTAFRHDGNWGGGGAPWNGDACPQVDDGLTAL